MDKSSAFPLQITQTSMWICLKKKGCARAIGTTTVSGLFDLRKTKEKRKSVPRPEDFNF